VRLSCDVSACATLGADAKTRLFAEILAHEPALGRYTKASSTMARKQARPAG